MIDDWKTWCAQASDADARIEVLGREHLDEILRLIRLHDSDDYRAARANFEAAGFDLALERHAHFALVDPDEGRPVGVCGYHIDDLEAEGVFWLGWTYVNPFVQGQGHGTRLMGFVLDTLAELGARKLYVSTSSLPKYEGAVAFYERHAFHLEGRLNDFYAPDEDKLILGREITGRSW